MFTEEKNNGSHSSKNRFFFFSSLKQGTHLDNGSKSKIHKVKNHERDSIYNVTRQQSHKQVFNK